MRNPRIRTRVFKCVESVFGASKIENPKLLRIEFWTSKKNVKKCSKRPWDPHNRIRLEKLCPKVVSDHQNAGRMPSKQRFWHCRPIRENRALNVNFFNPGTPPPLSEEAHARFATGRDPPLSGVALTDAKGGYGPNQRKPRIWPH